MILQIHLLLDFDLFLHFSNCVPFSSSFFHVDHGVFLFFCGHTFTFKNILMNFDTQSRNLILNCPKEVMDWLVDSCTCVVRITHRVQRFDNL